ncbi:ribbon-helix-helix protein, CopG family [Moraxella sp. RCAD0137]|uniref:ribbon-helix-helix protein, CopG family n=1 Tax=Moraxella sp. RCAD0137 TaxID=1775913 RepID=UPI000C9FC08B|nr:ribbon-helix-helix protein, CopG family [Moraxella sp. RCAD0137]
MSESKKTSITFRLDENLAKRFKEIAESNNRTQSLLLRDWIIEYVKKNQQTELKF